MTIRILGNNSYQPETNAKLARAKHRERLTKKAAPTHNAGYCTVVLL